jgi:hypothetical protein
MSNAADMSLRKLCDSFFALQVLLRTIERERGGGGSKVNVFGRTELFAPLSIFVFTIASVILVK